MVEVGNIIADLLQFHGEEFGDVRIMCRNRATALCQKYPIYQKKVAVEI
jgi:hypothetical protein